MRRVITSDLMKYMVLFETITRTKVIDSIERDNMLYFFVPDHQLGKAIGKQSSNVRRIEGAFNRKIKILGFNQKIEHFISNIIYPIKAMEVIFENKTVSIAVSDKKDKGALIGRDKANLNFLTEITKRFFDIDKIEVK